MQQIRRDLYCDVAVIGGGVGGCAAAIAAARRGLHVTLFEKGVTLGGLATNGYVPQVAGNIEGICLEFCQKLDEAGQLLQRGDVDYYRNPSFEPEWGKLILESMVVSSGARIMYDAACVDVEMADENTIRRCVFHTKQGKIAVTARIFIDATGDGDVAFRAGAPCELGDPARSGVMQPATTFFRICCLPEAAVEAVRAQYPQDGLCFKTLVAKARAEGRWTLPRPHINIYRGVKDGEWFVNVSRLNGVDATDPDSLSAAETEGRRQVREILDFLHDYVPGAEGVRLMSLPATVGIRESRHVLGEYRLDRDDVLEGRVPDDSIMLCSNSIDWHSGGKDAAGTLYLEVRDGDFYGVPYRCLVPRKVENLLVAGRCVSASAAAAAAIRVMPPCMAMGQAAGTAAALALQSDKTPRALDAATLVATLKSDGVYFG